MKRVGMIVAVEIDSVLKKYGDPVEKLEFPGYTILAYESTGYRLYVLHCGVGEIAAAGAAQFLISQLKVELIVNFGIVGGLTAEMARISTCIVEKVVHYDMDTGEYGGGGNTVGRYFSYPDIYIPATPQLVEKATELMPGLRKVICASGDKFVESAEKKQALHRQFGADICEMEAAGIVLTCNRNQIPVLLIKTVADSLTGGTKEFVDEFERASDACLDLTHRLITQML